MNRIPSPGAFDFLRRFRLARKPGAREGYGNRLSRGWGAAPEAAGIRPWDESATRMAAVASGRLGYPVAIETPRETRADLFLLFDQRSCLAFGSASQTVQERIITLGLALTLVALHDGWRIHPVVFGDHGLTTLPYCGRPEDWLRLHRLFTEWHGADGRSNHGFGPARRSLDLPGFCLFSDADSACEIMTLAGGRLGCLRVFDPWEKSPPLRAKMPLWGPRSQGQENWFHRTGRRQVLQDWQRRERLWEKEKSGQVFPPLSHATDEAWESALDPWFQHGVFSKQAGFTNHGSDSKR